MANDTPAPDATDIADRMANPAVIVAWWNNVKLYHEAMRDLGRKVVLRHHDEDNLYYLSSEEE